MATTHLKPHHISSGQTIFESMKDRFDYGQNPEKTWDGELIAAYLCDPKTADAEFTLSKAKYKAITGREQKKGRGHFMLSNPAVLCTRRNRPGKRAENRLRVSHALDEGETRFFVVSHVDRPHPHIHIYYNSTLLDCTGKFRNFWKSSFALRRLSDRICLENHLSVITDPKPHSKGKFKHYGEWLGDNKAPTFQERLKAQIDSCLANKPEDFAAFLALMQEAGYEVKQQRGVVSFRAEKQERFTRLRSSTLGKGYGQEEILAAIEGRVSATEGRKPAPRKVNLIIDIQEKMRAGKGPAYEQWAKVYNLKQMAATLQYLQENNLLEYAALEKKAADSTERFHVLSDQIKLTEAAQKRNSELMAAVVDYAKTRAVFAEYKAQKYSNKYLAEHRAEIETYRAAGGTFKRVLQGAKLPKMDALKAEGRALTAEKKAVYAEYRNARKSMQEAITAKHNIDTLFGITDERKNKEMER